ncbi:MAG: GAF domain-containing protein [Methylocystaceae bacterium]
MDYTNIAFSMSKIGIALNAETQLDNLWQIIINEVITFAGCDGCSLYIRQEEPLRLVFQASHTVSQANQNNGQPDSFAAIPLKLSRSSIAGYTAITGQTVNIPDCSAIADTESYRHNNSYDIAHGYHTVSVLSVPMKYHDGSVIGVIQLINKLANDGSSIPFPQELEKFIEAIASQAAVAIKNAQLQKIQTDSTFVFNTLLLSLCTYSFFLAILKTSHSSLFGLSIHELVTAGFSLLFLVISILIIRKTNLPLSFFGLTMKGTKQSLIEAAIATLVIMGLLSAIKLWMTSYLPTFAGHSIIDLSLISLSYFTYLFIAPIQEFVSRGVLQSSLERSLADSKFRSFLAIIVSSCVFGSFHLFYSVGMALVTVVSGLVWGWLFSRQRNLIGVSLSHFVIGNFIGLVGLWNLLLG